MSDDNFLILGKNIKRGESAVLEMDVAKLHTRNSLKIPVIIERAVLDGPVLLLIGGVHGDETNGVAIVRDIIRKKYNKPKRGTVICIPVFNVIGYLNHSREFPDGRDLNRIFPGSSNGSLASQFAHKFTKEIAPL
ncbi:succinylglutamate desuccinylase/aspartoacylase family protein, partial [Bacteroidota bacterium]